VPPVGAAIGGIISVFTGGALTFGGIGTALLKVAAGFGLTYISKALAGKPEDMVGVGAARPGGVQASLTTGDSNARTMIVGRWATAGAAVFMRAFGETNKTPHAYLIQVIKLSDLPISNVLDVYVNGEKVTWQSGYSGRGFPVPQYRKNGIDYLWIKVHMGDQTSADDYLTSKFPTGPRDWDADHIGFGCAYAVVTSRYSEKLYSGQRPECMFVLNGIKLYDPTKDSTVGGSGAHRWGQTDTYEFSNNPMVVIYNLMRGIRYKGAWVYGLQTVSPAQLPFASWAAAINECARIVTNRDGTSNAQYRCGAEIWWDTDAGAEIGELLKSCNGRIADCGGVYKPKVGPNVSAGAPVFSFTDGALLMTDEHEFEMFPTLDDVVNGVDATFVAPGDGWVEKALPPRRRTSYVEDDDDRENVADVTYAHVWDKFQAQRLSGAILKESRRFRRHVVVLPPEAYVLEPLDFVSWTSARNGYTNKLFRVESIADRNDGDQVIGLQEVDPTDYDWTPEDDEVDVPDGIQIVDRPPAQSIIGFTAVPLIIDGGSSIDRPGIRMTWQAAELDDVQTVKFEVRMSSPTGPLIAQDEMAAPEAGRYDLTKNLTSGIVYVVRAIFASPTPTRDFVWTNWITVTTPETPIFIEAFADALQELINAGSASGAVITEKVLPTPPGFQNLYRITVYGTGANANKSAGFYLFVDSAGVPGALLDIDQVAIGNLTTRQFPFVIEGGIVKIKRAAIQVLQSAQIAAGQITVGHLAVGAVSAAAIQNGIIDGTKIAPGAVNGSKLGPGAVTSDKLGPGAVTEGKIGLDAVTTAAIKDFAITRNEIQDAEIVASKMAIDSIYAKNIKAGEVKATHLASLAIETRHIGGLKLTGDKIADLTIKATNIDSGAIKADKIYSGTVQADKIQTKHFKSNEVSTRYMSGAVAANNAQVSVKRRGGVVLIGTFSYKCDKGQTLEVIIVKYGTSEPVGNCKYKLIPGDDINGAAQVVALTDQTNDNQTYVLKQSSKSSAREVTNYRLVALRVAP
jgi:hypothetical protein